MTITAENINLAREWLATIEPVGGIKMLPPEMQKILDTIEEALEIAMEKIGDERTEAC